MIHKKWFGTHWYDLTQPQVVSNNVWQNALYHVSPQKGMKFYQEVLKNKRMRINYIFYLSCQIIVEFLLKKYLKYVIL